MLPEDILEPGMFCNLTEVMVESKGNVTYKVLSYNCEVDVAIGHSTMWSTLQYFLLFGDKH